MVGVRRQVVGVGERAVEERRHRTMGEVVLAGGVAEPRADGCQLGEPGVALGVQAAVGAHDRRRRQLVEDEEHDRSRRRGDVDVADVAGRGARHQLGRRAEEQERGEEEQVGHGEVGDEEPDPLGPHHEHDDDDTDEHRQEGDDDELVDADRAQQCEAERRRQDAADSDEHDVAEPGVDRRRQRGEADAEGRRDDRDRQRRRARSVTCCSCRRRRTRGCCRTGRAAVAPPRGR